MYYIHLLYVVYINHTLHEVWFLQPESTNAGYLDPLKTAEVTASLDNGLGREGNGGDLSRQPLFTEVTMSCCLRLLYTGAGSMYTVRLETQLDQLFGAGTSLRQPGVVVNLDLAQGLAPSRTAV